MRRPQMTRLAGAAVLATAIAGIATTATTAPAATEPPITFGVPRIVDPIHAYGEPNMIVNPNGTVHASGPQGTGVQRSIWNISVDAGDSYRLAQATQCPDVCPEVPAYDQTGLAPSKSDLGPGGGDTELAADQHGHVYYNDLYALTCFSASYTEDDGKTIQSSPAGCSHPGGDREWMALFDPKPEDHTISPYTGKVPLLYMEYADQTAGDRVDFTTDGTDYNLGDAAGEYCDDNVHNPNHGVPVVDQYTGDFLGLCSDEGGGLALAIGVPDETGHLTFHYQTAVPPEATSDPETLFPILTIDKARNLYAVWIDHEEYRVHYAWAPPGADNEWTKWSNVRTIDQPPSNVNLFPWAQAGGDGILDIAWYGTDMTLEELGPNGPSERKDQVWHVYFSQVDKANTNAPHVVQVQATPHPMHYNDICMLGTLCISAQGNRNQADFFKLFIDPAGRAEIIYTDSSNRLSQANGTDSGADHQGAPLDVVIRQRTGLNAWTGKPLAADDSTAPAAGVTDWPDDALLKPLGGTNIPGADITKLAVNYTGETFDIDVDIAGGSLSGVATAGKTPFAQLIVRWQIGDVLYHAGVQDSAAGGQLRAFAGPTKSVDLCSVSGCKPNYLDYRADPLASGTTVTAEGTGPTHYTIKVPATAIGSPANDALFESVMGFVALAPRPAETPLDNAMAEADEVNLQIEGTRTFNYARGASAVLPPGAKAVAGQGDYGWKAPNKPPVTKPPVRKPPARPDTHPVTGLPAVLPVAALVAFGAALAVRRRRRAA
ncbi:MAG TPA: hypothetical protein VF519_14905 [Mycobacteriales bacterium]